MEALYLIIVVNVISWMISKYYPIKNLEWYKNAAAATPIIPSGYVFSIIWTFLYSLIAVVLYRVLLRVDSFDKRANLTLIIGLILVSYSYMPVFVNQDFLWSSAIIQACLLLTLLAIINLVSYDKVSSLMLVPWFVWLIGALVFNGQIATVKFPF